MRDLLILLVEDDAIDAERVQRSIDAISPPIFRLIHVANLRDAVKSVEENSFHAVILDLGLPDSAGLGGAEKLIGLIPDIPVIVLTGDTNQDLAIRAIEIGVEEFLEKERVDAYQLIRVIRHAAKRKQRAIALAADTTDGVRDRNALAGIATILKETASIVTARTAELRETDLTTSQQSIVQKIEDASNRSVDSAEQYISGLDGTIDLGRD